MAVRIIGVNIEQSQQQQLARANLETLRQNKVKVKLLGRTEDELLAQCFMKSYGLWRTCIGSSMLERGLGRVENSELKAAVFNKTLQKYQSRLAKHELKAKKRKVGVWKTSDDSENLSLMQKIKKIFGRQT